MYRSFWAAVALSVLVPTVLFAALVMPWLQAVGNQA